MELGGNIPVKSKDAEKAITFLRSLLNKKLGKDFVSKYIDIDIYPFYPFDDGSIVVFYYIKDKKEKYDDKKIVFIAEDLLFYQEVYIKAGLLSCKLTGNEKVKQLPAFNKGESQKIDISLDKALKILRDYSKKKSADSPKDLAEKVKENKFRQQFAFSEHLQRFGWAFSFLEKSGHHASFERFFVDAETGEVKFLDNTSCRMIGSYGNFVPSRMELT